MELGHHFMEASVGVLSTNSFEEGSYSAVVCSPRTFEPWPSSVLYLRDINLEFQLEQNKRTEHKRQ